MDDLFSHGIELFNRGEYFDAHEVLERVWLHTHPADRFFLQSLIHVAVAFHHHANGNSEGARLQLEKAVRKLAGYLPSYCGLQTARLYRDAQIWLLTLPGGGSPAEPPAFHWEPATIGGE